MEGGWIKIPVILDIFEVPQNKLILHSNFCPIYYKIWTIAQSQVKFLLIY